MGSLPTLAWACMWPPLFASVWWHAFRSRPGPSRFYEAWGCAGFGGVLTYGVSRQVIPVVISVAQIILAVFLWWLSRRRRRRAPKPAGYKARALIAAIVRKAREAARPRPVLRPVPGGAR